MDVPDLVPISSVQTYEQVQSIKTNLVWQKLDAISVEDAIFIWLQTLSPKTRLNYQSGMFKLIDLVLIDSLMNLQSFSIVNYESIIDRIKLLTHWSECSRQARAACYISFTGFLNRRFQGLIKKALPNKEGTGKTFFKVYEKVKTSALTQAQWFSFFSELEEINPRDCLIAKVILQGGKRVSEVLSLQVSQIDWNRCEITFAQSKTKGVHKETVITYPETILKALKAYVGIRNGFAFVTKSGKPITLKQLARTFARAGIAANIPFKVTPHVLRASAVTYLKQQGFPDSDIMGVTGHASSEMVYAHETALQAGLPPNRLSFVHSVRVIRRKLKAFSAFSPLVRLKNFINRWF